MFGSMRKIAGKGGIYKSTKVPAQMVSQLKVDPIPITISTTTTTNDTFTINASSTRIASVWLGNEYAQLIENLSYSWVAGSNNILDSTGAATTNTGSTLGIWYAYLGYADDGTLTIYMSQTAPGHGRGPFENGNRSHPGAARERQLAYVGMMLCTTAATPVFETMVKVGYSYLTSYTNRITADTEGTTVAAVAGFTGATALPGHGALGCTVGGSLETGGAAAAITHIAEDTNGTGEIRAKGTAAAAGFAPFDGIHPTSAGTVIAWHTHTAGDVHVTRLNDIV